MEGCICDMSDNQAANFIYLLILLILFVARFAASRQWKWTEGVRSFLIWCIIGAFFVVGYSLDVQKILKKELFLGTYMQNGEKEIVIKQKMDGHFYIDVAINGKKMNFLIDTGATNALIYESDLRGTNINAGDLEYIHSVATANGGMMIAKQEVNMKIGNFLINDVVIGIAKGGGTCLLGMNVLEKFGSIKIEGDDLFLILR